MASVIFEACAWLIHKNTLSEESSGKDFSLGSKILDFIYFHAVPFLIPSQSNQQL